MRGALLCACFLAAFLAGGNAFATLQTGDTQPNFTLNKYGTSQQVNLYNDLAGKIVVLDFFTYWCGYCSLAAYDLEPNVQQYYAALGGNASHIPVQLVSLETDGSSPSSTQSYITAHSLDYVLDDTSSTVFNYYNHGGWPQFAIIDTTAGTNYKQWQVLWTQYGYSSDLSSTVRGVINAVTINFPGDANRDGKVDINDLNTVLAHYSNNTPGRTWAQGDFNGDGKVDINDLNTVLFNYDKARDGAGLSAVPEPSCLVLLAAGIVSLLALRRRRA